MNKVFLLPILFVTGCATTQAPPIDVTLIPNDCANRRAITDWLEHNIKQGTNHAETSSLKNRLWQIRYHCDRS